jgi:hypothetical protein
MAVEILRSALGQRALEFFGGLEFSLSIFHFGPAISATRDQWSASSLDHRCSVVPRLQLGFAETARYGIALISHRNCNLLEIFQDRQLLLEG